MSRRAPRSASEHVYALLLHLYPAAFRQAFADDMTAVHRDQFRAARAEGGIAVMRLWIRTVAALLWTALLERIDALADQSFRSTLDHGRKGDTMLQNVVHDVRFASRMLRKSPIVTSVAVLLIALGTGAVTTIFSAANAIALRPLPGTTRPDRLVDLHRTHADGSGGSLTASYPYYRRLQQGTHTLSDVVAWGMFPLTVSKGGEGIASLGNIVTGNYFRALGLTPFLGRFFVADEDATPGTHPVVVVSYGFWQGRLGADSSVVGRELALNGHPFTIIGVAPPKFQGVFAPLRTDAWVPMMMQEQLRSGGDLNNAGAGWLQMFGRLKDGATEASASAELTALMASQSADLDEPREFRLYSLVSVSTLTGLPSEAHGAVVGFMVLLLSASGLVLLIACVNVAAIVLARSVARRREMALRVAMGARRGRLITQLLTENLLLFLLGAAGGVGIAIQATKLMQRISLPVDLPFNVDLAPDARVLMFTVLVSVITGVLFGLAPALQASRTNLTNQLHSGTAGSGARRSRARSVLIVGQMALSLLLLVAAGLFVRALDRGRRVDPGFDTANVIVASLDAQTYGYDESRGREFYQTLKERLAAVPGVSAVSYTKALPLSMNNMGDEFRVDGYTPAVGTSDRGVPIYIAKVERDYFSVLNIPLLRGRSFSLTDDAQSPKVAVVNATLAKKFWPNGDALGRLLHRGKDDFIIVGVVRDAKYSTLDEDPTPFAYLSLAQDWGPSQVLIVRARGDMGPIQAAIREAMRTWDAALPPPVTTTLSEAISVVLLPQRVAAAVTGVLGLLGLLLASVGLYGIISYSVTQRTREIGVRMALGAGHYDVVRLVVREGMRLVSIGMSIGLVLALALSRVMTRFLFGVSPLDALTFVGMTALLTAVALTASYLPARRAAAANPTTSLRYDG